ncbi:unnamed protein product [Caenorhabditis sp. 36 PRJEB53466]|nr:unnamed protein product [Caenorhabditis sp. 36 PRJEB53466]
MSDPVSSIRAYIEILTKLANQIEREGGVRTSLTGSLVRIAKDAHDHTNRILEREKNERTPEKAFKAPLPFDRSKSDYRPRMGAPKKLLSPPGSVSAIGNIRRQRFTVFSVWFGLSNDVNKSKVAEILTNIGIRTEEPDVSIPAKKKMGVFEEVGSLSRITFEVDHARTLALLRKFDGDRCDLTKSSDNYFTCYLQDATIFKELSDWDVLKMTFTRYAILFLRNAWPWTQGFILEAFKDTLTVWKSGSQIKMYKWEMLMENKQLVDKTITHLTEEGKNRMKAYLEKHSK